jgi:hypothetical protein
MDEAELAGLRVSWTGPWLARRCVLGRSDALSCLQPPKALYDANGNDELLNASIVAYQVTWLHWRTNSTSSATP